jgi:hypothetical protein
LLNTLSIPSLPNLLSHPREIIAKMDHEKLARMQNAVRIGKSMLDLRYAVGCDSLRYDGIVLTIIIG